jgi:glyoxylase-like metal-dependent hydrolase (beta-lactamase superfamily II)
VTTEDTYEVFALRYATRDAQRRDHFLYKDRVVDPDAPMPMDYFVWLIRNSARTVLVDTGFSEPVGTRRGRTHLRSPAGAVGMIGSPAEGIADVIITHMHYDHSGTVRDFPNARLHLQERELRWVTSSEMFERSAQGSFEADDVVNIVRGLYDRRLQLHEGAWSFAPGIDVHLVPGHTPGIQVVTVNTARGKVVLASDTTHYYENMETGEPFATTYDADLTRAGFKMLGELADSPRHIVPGHDPLVMQRYPAASKDLEGIVVRLDADPNY